MTDETSTRPAPTNPTMRVVAARHPDGATIEFDPQLTLLNGDAGLAEWLVGAVTDTTTIVNVDGPLVRDPAGHRPQIVTAAALGVLFNRTRAATLADIDRDLDEIAEELDELRPRQRAAQARYDALQARELELDVRIDGREVEALALADELAELDAEISASRPRATIGRELAKWERVTGEARGRLLESHEQAARVQPADLAEALRLRNEWRYAEQVHRQMRRRRTRREVDELKQHYERFLGRFGATTYEDLAVVGTGFGNTDADLAIREAATVVSMAEQHCVDLRAELEASDPAALERRRRDALARASVLLGRGADADVVTKLRRLQPGAAGAVGTGEADLATDWAVNELDRLAIEVRALEVEQARLERSRQHLAAGAPIDLPGVLQAVLDADDERAAGTMLPPLVVDHVFESFVPTARRRVFDALLAHSRARQVILVDDDAELLTWAAACDAVDWSAH